MIWRRQGVTMSRLEHLIPPPLVALLSALAMLALAKASGPSAIDEALRVDGASALFILGLAIAALGAFAFQRQGADINPHKIDRGDVLVTSGVFRWTRNPMYLGLTLILCGYAFYLARPLCILGPIFFVPFITRFQIIPEERAMLAKFGERYANYFATTRRWI
jgi:protein-S-isoprenylcysteine O-methyltransferase Ste14